MNEIPAEIDRARFTAAMRRELPGVSFTVHHDDHTEEIEMLFERRVEVMRYRLSQVWMLDVDPMLERSALHAIDKVREKTIEDYGLVSYVERQKAEAATAAKDKFVSELKAHADKYRESVRTLDGWVAGDLPRDIAALLDWASRA